jgi:hypothetical protein
MGSFFDTKFSMVPKIQDVYKLVVEDFVKTRSEFTAYDVTQEVKVRLGPNVRITHFTYRNFIHDVVAEYDLQGTQDPARSGAIVYTTNVVANSTTPTPAPVSCTPPARKSKALRVTGPIRFTITNEIVRGANLNVGDAVKFELSTDETKIIHTLSGHRTANTKYPRGYDCGAWWYVVDKGGNIRLPKTITNLIRNDNGETLVAFLDKGSIIVKRT